MNRKKITALALTAAISAAVLAGRFFRCPGC